MKEIPGCNKCQRSFRNEIQTYNENALFLDSHSPELLIKTERGSAVGCFYCFPVRIIKKGFVHFRDDIQQDSQK